MAKGRRLDQVNNSLEELGRLLKESGVCNPLVSQRSPEMVRFALSQGNRGPVLFIDPSRGTIERCLQDRTGWNGFTGGVMWRSFIETLGMYISSGLQMLDPRFFRGFPSMSAPAIAGCSAEQCHALEELFGYVMRKPSPGLASD